jgi:hypothetical protein
VAAGAPPWLGNTGESCVVVGACVVSGTPDVKELDPVDAWALVPSQAATPAAPEPISANPASVAVTARPRRLPMSRVFISPTIPKSDVVSLPNVTSGLL